jgi:hypothetical protein
MPAFVFPFVRLFDTGGDNDGVCAFEVILSILYNCGQRWFEVHSHHPPFVNLLDYHQINHYHDTFFLLLYLRVCMYVCMGTN